MFEELQGQSIDVHIKTELDLLLGRSASAGQFSITTPVTLEGVMTVHIGKVFKERDGRAVLPWTVSRMRKAGKLEGGEITAADNPAMPIFGTIRPRRRRDPFPADLKACVHMLMTIPGYPKLSNPFPFIIEALVNAVPPFGVTATSRTIGILVGTRTRTVHGLVGA